MRFSPLTIGLGVTMTIGYGTLYYSFSVLAPEIAQEFGWGESFVFGIFSVGLLAGASVAAPLGRLADRFGARLVLSLGSLAAAAVLALLGLMQNAGHFILLALAGECIALAAQYEAGFAALAQIHGREARSHITLVTLIAGFASTIYWPLLQWLLTLITWREIYFLLAAMNLAIALPIHLLLPRVRHVQNEAVEAEDVEGGTPINGRRAIVLMAIAFAAGGFVLSAVGATLLVLLASLGYGATVATLAGSLIGPSQVAARLIGYLRRNLFSPPVTAVIAAVSMTLGLMLLFGGVLAGPMAIFVLSFALLYGAGQGLTSIARGVLPLHYFGAAGYGRRTGSLASVRIIVSALAPFTIIWLNEAWGAGAAIAAILAVALVSVAAILALVMTERPAKRPSISSPSGIASVLDNPAKSKS
ncbi:MFS transporter [Peteryoungia ipomoeae]|uniref:MFS transporter n=1 Tax=Peteryoungia ipomoeae TaxID=1210932 RepID=A0A4S8P1W3_9HYPH|nr:MFS transporter [Peteryoungia ipomoeae]THV24030.1 MFS transporter [Peteryoungia ipomoeae]